MENGYGISDTDFASHEARVLKDFLRSWSSHQRLRASMFSPVVNSVN